ncbi:MAG: hypothetical protein R2828_09390 [Saprospiraceae bacterium]
MRFSLRDGRKINDTTFDSLKFSKQLTERKLCENSREYLKKGVPFISVKLLSIFFLGITSVFLNAQEIVAPLVPPNELAISLQNMMNHLSTVTTEKERFEQTLVFETEAPYLVTLEVKTFKGNKVTNDKYQFNLVNIDQDQIDYSQKKTHYEIKISCLDKQKFILPFTNGKQDNYTQSFTLYAVDPANAQAIQAGFRAAIAQAREQVNERVELVNLDNGMEWLAENTRDVRGGNNFFQQSFTRGKDIATQVTFNLDEEEAVVNLIDLNPNTIAIDVQGKKLFVTGQTTDKVAFITERKKGELKGYSNKFSVMVETVEEGKLMVNAIQQMIPWAREAFRIYVPVVDSREESLALLKEHLAIGIDGGDPVNQEIGTSCITELTQTKSTKNGSSKTSVNFNFNDLDHQNLDVSIAGKTITLDMVTADKTMLFQSFDNGVFEKYSNKQVIYASDVENARYLQQLLPKVISNCKTDLVMKAPLGAEGAFQWIADHTTAIETPTAAYQQSLVQDAANACKWTFNQTIEKSKKTVSHTYDFELGDLDAEKIDFNISSKELAIEITAQKRQKAIQHAQDDGKGSPEVNSFLLLLDNIEMARQMMTVWEQAIQGCK